MALRRWNPLGDLLALQDRLDRLADEEPGWRPPVDLYETPDRYVVTAELAGVPRERIQIQIQDGRLSLRGTRPEPDVRCQNYHQMERGHGTFCRSFRFPQPVDAEAVRAEFDAGVLTITVPKIPKPEPRRIAVAE